MKKLIVIIASLVAALAIVSCDKYEDGKPSKDVRNEFSRMYPSAWDVEWENQGAYWEVSFETGSRPDGTDHKAWYDKGGNWIQTCTEVLLSAVPQSVKDYLMASEFGTGQFEDNDAEFFETQSGNFYRFDIRMGGREIDVDVTEDGKVSQAMYGF